MGAKGGEEMALALFEHNMSTNWAAAEFFKSVERVSLSILALSRRLLSGASVNGVRSGSEMRTLL